VEKLIILKNNEPKVVLLSVEAYEAMEEEVSLQPLMFPNIDRLPF